MTQTNNNKGVLVIYTGGTIGSAPRDPDPNSPQIVVPWERLKKETPELLRLPFPIEAYEFKEPLDSCNVGPLEWAEMGKAIADNYEKYEGFVILHGTDTMVYTASALSFMLRELGKPVVITGAQRSAMVDYRNDASQNFITALLLANPAASGLPLIPEVVIYFGSLILRGNRSVKRDTSGYQAYETPNLNPLGVAGNRILIDQKLVRPRPGTERRFHVRSNLETNVLPIRMYPGIQNTSIVQTLLKTQGLKGVVVHAYGSGDIPTKREFIQAFSEARQRGIVVAVVTQCPKGPVELGIYDTSALLLQAGMVAGYDITVEAAQCKLMSLLAEEGMSQEEIESEFQRNLAGEQSVSVYTTHFPDIGNKYLDGPVAKAEDPVEFRIPGRPLGGRWEASQIGTALLRFRGARVQTPKNEEAQLRIFVNMNPGDKPTNDHPGFAGAFKKSETDETTIAFFDVTRALKPVARVGERIPFTVVLDTVGAKFSWQSVELALFVREAID